MYKVKIKDFEVSCDTVLELNQVLDFYLEKQLPEVPELGNELAPSTQRGSRGASARQLIEADILAGLDNPTISEKHDVNLKKIYHIKWTMKKAGRLNASPEAIG